MYVEPLTTKVTNINGVYHCRLLRFEKVHTEMGCNHTVDIRICFREMLRWYDKLGYSPYSKMADAARHRGKNADKPVGRMWKVKLKKDNVL